MSQKVKKGVRDAAEMMTLHLGLAERTASRLQKVMSGKVSVLKDVQYLATDDHTLEELKIVEDELKGLVGDAMAARCYLREIAALKGLVKSPSRGSSSARRRRASP